jgi:hypothetical protein
MNHSERVRRYETYMAAEGIPRNTASPKPWQWLWSRGIECAPPPFMSWLALALYGGLVLSSISIALWVYSYVLHPFWHHMPARYALWITGVSFGVGALLVPIYYRRLARRCGLASWSSFHGKRQLP